VEIQKEPAVNVNINVE